MGIITDVLQGIPLNAVLREKIVVLETKMSDLESENLILKTKLEHLEADNIQLKNKIKHSEELNHLPYPHDEYMPLDPEAGY